MTIRQLRIENSNKHPFCLDSCAESAQDFRWCKLGDGWYSVVLDGNLIHIRQNDDGVEYESDSDADLDRLLHSYFRLDDDMDDIYEDISRRCDTVAHLVEKYPSHRILRQPDRWECMVAYICSANKKISDISKTVESIACRIGKPLELNGETRHAFPTPEMVFAAGEGPLKEVWSGFKSIPRRIIAAAERIHNDKLDLCELAEPDVPYEVAKRQLMQKCSASRKVANGIADKIADCICLFALDKMEAFPVDRHIQNAVQECRCSPRPPSSKTAIVKWAHERFDKRAGYANQLLFKGAWDESQKSRDDSKQSQKKGKQTATLPGL